MSRLRALLFMSLLLAGPVLAGGSGAGFGFHGGGFSAGFGFHGGTFHGGAIHGGGFGFPGFGFHPGFAGRFPGVGGFPGDHLRPGRGRFPGYGVPYAYGPVYPSRYGSGYNRHGWRKWWTYTDFSQINYPGVYPVTVKPVTPQSDRDY